MLEKEIESLIRMGNKRKLAAALRKFAADKQNRDTDVCQASLARCRVIKLHLFWARTNWLHMGSWICHGRLFGQMPTMNKLANPQ